MNHRERLMAILGTGPATEMALVARFIHNPGLPFDEAVPTVKRLLAEALAGKHIETTHNGFVYRLTAHAAPMEPTKEPR